MYYLGRISLLFALSFSLIACSGGSSTPTNNDAGGIWNGTVTNNGITLDSIGFISESGKAYFVTGDEEVYSARIGTTDNNFSGSGTAYYIGGLETGVNVSGTFVEQTSMTGTSNAGANFSYTYDPIYDRDSSLAAISGTYSDTTDGYTETYTIDIDGDITGSDSDGCVFGGSVSIIDPEFNMYNIALTVANCGDLNGTFRGLLALTDDTAPNDTLAIMAESSIYLIAGTIPKV